MLERKEDLAAHQDEPDEALASIKLSDIAKQAQASADMTALLNSIPGALEAHQKGLEDVAAGNFVTLEELSMEDILPGGSGPITVTVEDIMEVTGLSRENAEGLMRGVIQAALGDVHEYPDLLLAIEDVVEDEDISDELVSESQTSDLAQTTPRKSLTRRGRDTPEQVAAANARAKAYFASEPEEADEREQALRGAMNLLKQRNGFLEEAIIEQEIEETVRQRLTSGKSREVDLDEIAASHGYKPEDYRQVD